MTGDDDDLLWYEEQDAAERFLNEELRRISEEPVFYYLAVNGDAIEERVQRCIDEARRLLTAGHYGAALVRAASGIEVTVRFFLARPLLQGAFLSDDWAKLLSRQVLNGRTAKDRELLPAILQNWAVDVTKLRLSDGGQLWERVVATVWPRRNDYLHKGDDVSEEEAHTSVECLESLLRQVVDPLANRLGFTRDQTGCWSVVKIKNPPEFPDLNPPRRHERRNPFT
jgi:hypothetical protein